MRQKKKLRKLKKLLKRVKSWQERMAGLKDEELSALTVVFRSRLAEGETLDDLLPEAYAAVCEADRRILGKFPYDVQVLGTIANGYQIVNRADVGGKYQGTWQTAQATWVTIVRKLTTNPTLPKTGY